MSAKLEEIITDLESALEELEYKATPETTGRILSVIERYEAKGIDVPPTLKNRAHRLSDQAAEDMFDNMPV